MEKQHFVSHFGNSCWHGPKGKQLEISPFPTVFSTLLESFTPFSSQFEIVVSFNFSLEESKINRMGMG